MDVEKALQNLRPHEKKLLDSYVDPRPRDRLLDFTLSTFPTYKPDPAHVLIAEALDKVFRGETKRLMIFAPPQHGKSELVSVRFPAFWLAHRPNDSIILTSYGGSLACSKSRLARNVIESTEFKSLFPNVRTNPRSRAVDCWGLQGYDGRRWQDSRGVLLAAGVGGAITGYGGMLGIGDDLLKGWAESQSVTVREQTWEWYRSTFRPRLWEDAAIVLVMTRWHEEDVAGKLLTEQGEKWTVLRLPALAETQEVRDFRNESLGLPTSVDDPLGRTPGEALCPQRFSQSSLGEIKSDVGSLVWAAQYDGFPTAPEGNRFKRSWFEIVSVVPAKGRRVRYWDKAATAGEGDFTVGTLMVKSADKQYFIEDVVRGQWSALERDRMMKQTAVLDDTKYPERVQVWAEQEPGSGGKESAEATIRLLAGHLVKTERSTGSKEVRASPFAAQCEAQNVKLLKAPWNRCWLDEICGFPNAAHDDQVDTSSGAFLKLVRDATKAYFGLA